MVNTQSGAVFRSLIDEWPLLLNKVLGAGSPLLIPARALLFAAGCAWVLAVRRGGVLVAIWTLFVALTLAFSFLDLEIVRLVFRATFPWGEKDRLAQIESVIVGMVGAGGVVYLAQGLRSFAATRLGHLGANTPRRALIGALLLVFVLAEGSLVSIVKTLQVSAEKFATYSNDDAAAFQWLKEHRRPGAVLLNDGGADAGIWAPYKADVAIVESRFRPLVDADVSRGLRENVARLDAEPTLLATACALPVSYVYHGAKGTDFEDRRMPPLPELRDSPVLEEVFSRGNAVVFRVRLACPE